jgi:small subunit ribosomal protein S20
LARTPRTWTGARSSGGLKRVRQAARRHAVLQPRRSAAKTLVAKAIRVSTVPVAGTDPNVALIEAISALDRAAKAGAIHANAAARRKSRLVRKVNAALGGAHVTGAHVAKQTSKAQAAKAAKARIAASKADKAKGAQTAAGKARAALTRTTRTEGVATPAPTAESATPSRPAGRAAKAGTTKTTKSGTAGKTTTTRKDSTKG